MASKRAAKNRSTPAPSPLEAQKRAIAQEEARIKAQEERYRRLIEQAPRIAAERRKKEREAFLNRVSRTEARFGDGGRVLEDKRFPYELNVEVAARRKILRKHRRQGMLTFFFLCFVLALVLAWVYFSVIRS